MCYHHHSVDNVVIIGYASSLLSSPSMHHQSSIIRCRSALASHHHQMTYNFICTLISLIILRVPVHLYTLTLLYTQYTHTALFTDLIAPDCSHIPVYSTIQTIVQSIHLQRQMYMYIYPNGTLSFTSLFTSTHVHNYTHHGTYICTHTLCILYSYVYITVFTVQTYHCTSCIIEYTKTNLLLVLDFRFVEDDPKTCSVQNTFCAVDDLKKYELMQTISNNETLQ